MRRTSSLPMVETVEGPALPVSLRSALVQVVRQCNFRCSHCSQVAPHTSIEGVDGADLIDLKKRLDELVARGLSRVRFTGGEPLLHPHLPDLIRYAASSGLDTSIVTNGVLLPRVADRLIDAGLGALWISLYGPTHASYASVAHRSPPSFTHSRMIKLFSSRGVRVGLYCAVDLRSPNLGLSLVSQLAEGLSHVKFLQMMEQGRNLDLATATGELNAAALLEIVRFKSSHPEVEVSVSMRSGQRRDFERLGFRIPEHVGCTLGMQDSWSIDVDGSPEPCCLMMGPKAKPRAEIGLHHGCPAMPEYGIRERNEFICPLTYATA